MSKYGPLADYLANSARVEPTIEFGFAELDVLVGGLPPSARKLRTWWANNSHTQSLAWRSAGWHVEMVNVARERVRFARGAVGGTYADRGRRPAPTTIPLPENGSSDESSSATHRIILIGCVKTKADHPLPARDLCTSPLFARRRAYAERSGDQWFVLSSRWGLLSPSDVIAPYDMWLADQPAKYREAWGEFVVAQLEISRVLAHGATVETHAGKDYIDALRKPLSVRGIGLATPVDAHSLGETLQWYDRVAHRGVTGEGSANAADVRVESALTEALLVLSDNRLARTPAELLASGRDAWASPGLYSWWADESASRDLSVGLGERIEPGLIYAGSAGATHWPSGKRSANTLWGRLAEMHLRGSVDFSTFRKTLDAVLRAGFGLDRVDESTISAWMSDHLRVVAWPFPDADVLGRIERAMLKQLHPPLNLLGMKDSAVRVSLKRLRSVAR